VLSLTWIIVYVTDQQGSAAAQHQEVQAAAGQPEEAEDRVHH